MDPLKKEKIALEVIRTLKSRFDNFPENASDNRNAPFHKAFLQAFKLKIENHVTDIPIFVSLASWMHGLNTTLGQSFFECVAQILCDGEKREFNDLLINSEQQAVINEIITGLKNGTISPNLINENRLLMQNINNFSIRISNFTADVYFEDNEKIVAIELKTVKPNSGIFKNEKEKMLYAKAGLKNKYPEKQVYYYLGFPFDPLNESGCGYDKNRFFNYGIDFKKFIDPTEILLADELWDFLSEEERTMETILEIINSISKPNFIEKFNFTNDYNNFENYSERFTNILKEWFLERELKITENFALLSEIENPKSIRRFLKQNIFDLKGKYRKDRINILLETIKK